MIRNAGRLSVRGLPAQRAGCKPSQSVPCPECGKRESVVVDSRAKSDYTRRRRVCVCGFRFTTHEIAVAEGGYVLDFQI